MPRSAAIRLKFCIDIGLHLEEVTAMGSTNQYDDIKDIQDMSDDEQNALQELMKGFAV